MPSAIEILGDLYTENWEKIVQKRIFNGKNIFKIAATKILVFKKQKVASKFEKLQKNLS